MTPVRGCHALSAAAAILLGSLGVLAVAASEPWVSFDLLQPAAVASVAAAEASPTPRTELERVGLPPGTGMPPTGVRGRVADSARRGPNPRRRALQALGTGELCVEVFDRSTGQRVRSFRYALSGPGLEPVCGEVRDAQLTLSPLVRMPANLRIDAPGYARADLRQILLTRDRPSRTVQVYLEAP